MYVEFSRRKGIDYAFDGFPHLFLRIQAGAFFLSIRSISTLALSGSRWKIRIETILGISKINRWEIPPQRIQFFEKPGAPVVYACGTRMEDAVFEHAVKGFHPIGQVNRFGM